MTVAPKKPLGASGTSGALHASRVKRGRRQGRASRNDAIASINILSSHIEVGIDSGSAATTLALTPPTTRLSTICEASQRPTMRFVQIKSEAAQASAVVFRARDLLVRQRTQIINALRGHLDWS